MLKYYRSLSFASFVEVVCCDIFYVPLHSVNGKFFFVWGSFPLVYVEYYSMY